MVKAVVCVDLVHGREAKWGLELMVDRVEIDSSLLHCFQDLINEGTLLFLPKLF